MVCRYDRRDDWCVITDEEAAQIGRVPGVKRERWTGREFWICHLTHLPLLGVVDTAGGKAQEEGVERLTPKPNPPVLSRLPYPQAQIFADGKTELRDYQVAGRDFIRSRRGTLLADGCRIGKTAEIIAAHDPADGPLVVVAPLAVRPVWLDWFARRWPDVPACVLTGRQYDRRYEGAGLIFIHYDVVAAWASVGMGKPIGTLVIDEAHLIANRKTARSQTLRMMATGAKRIVAATGTPLWNAPEGIWPLLDAVNPAAWGAWGDFTVRYASGGPGEFGWQTGEPSNVHELRQRLAEVMLCRRWKDVQAELPPTVSSLEAAVLSVAEWRRVDHFAGDQFVQRIESGKIHTVVAELETYRRLVAKAKAKVAIAAAQAIITEGSPVVVWVWHQDVAKVIGDALEAIVVTGETPQATREGMLQRWRDGVSKALVISMGVAPAGIDLSHAAHAVFAELDWTPATMGQAAMRTFSPSRPNFLTYVVADHWIDQKLLEVIVGKLHTAETMGMPATDTVMDVIVQGLTAVPEADLGALADLISRRR